MKKIDSFIDAFSKKIGIGKRVLYSPDCRGTVYHKGKIVRLIPPGARYPAKVEIEITESSKDNYMTRNPIVYACNTVLI